MRRVYLNQTMIHEFVKIKIEMFNYDHLKKYSRTLWSNLNFSWFYPRVKPHILAIVIRVYLYGKD